jgi:Zn-dependent protease
MAEHSPALPRTPLGFSFRLGPFPVAVESTFFLFPLIAFFGSWLVLAWVAVCFAAVLVHELGHALAARRYGAGASIRLYLLGGLTSHDALPEPRQRVLVALAGPAAGFLLALPVLALDLLLPPARHPAVAFAVQALLSANVTWGLVNLLPVPPLDGGHVLEEVLGPRRKALALQIGAAVAALAAVAGFQRWGWVAAVMFALLALRALATWLRLAAERRIQRQLTGLRRRMWEQAVVPEEANEDQRESLRQAMRELRDASFQLPPQPEPDQDRDPALLARIFEELGVPGRAAEHAVDAYRRDPSGASALQAVRLLLAAGRRPEAEAMVIRTRWSTEATRAEAEALLQSPSPTRSRR